MINEQIKHVENKVKPQIIGTSLIISSTPIYQNTIQTPGTPSEHLTTLTLASQLWACHNTQGKENLN